MKTKNVKDCEHPAAEQKLVLFDADPNTGEVIEKTYECALCLKEFHFKFRETVEPRRMARGAPSVVRRFH